MKEFTLMVFFIFVFATCKAKEELIDLFVKPGSQRGCITIVNNQSMVDETLIKDAINILYERKRFNFKITKDKSLCRDSAIHLSIIDNPTDPIPMTVSPEAGRGILNVAALTNDLTTVSDAKRLLPNRAKLELLRLICYSFGVGGSQFSGNLLSATSIQELDDMEPFLPVDIFDKIETSGKKRGLQPEILAEYHEACQQGWAPAPTNDVQKAIWDKVHATPKNPIRIEFDPKKGR